MVVGPNTWEKVKDHVVGGPIGEVALKGKALPMLLHEVTALKIAPQPTFSQPSSSLSNITFTMTAPATSATSITMRCPM